MPPKRRQELNDSEPGSSEYELTAAEQATADRLFRCDSPNALALAMGADIVDEEQAKLVEALQETFKAHMNKYITSTGVNMNDFVEANNALTQAKAELVEKLRDIYKNLGIDDRCFRLNLIEINRTLHSIEIAPDGTLNLDIIDETISSIVNKHIPTSEIVRQAIKKEHKQDNKRQRTKGGKTNRKHKTNKKHKTNRRKHKTNRRKHRKTRKN